ncbi:MAG: choice-of-anchor J domain-containing protein [Dokdonia sp.]|jgi:hypothetical protein
MMKKITLIAAVFAAFSMNAQVTIWEDSFEDFPDFDLAFDGYTQIDNDASATYGSSTYDFTNEQYVGTGIVFNPSQALDGGGVPASDDPNWQARTGDKGAYFFAATSLLNDDYLITPQISLAGASGSEFTFYAKSITDDFGLERFSVLLSTTGTDEADFTVDLSGGEQQAPIGDYTEYNYDLSAYDGEDIYIAIRYTAQDSFVMLTDDWSVTAASLSVDDLNANGFSQFVDADANLNLRANVALENVELFNIVGQQVMSQKLSSNDASISLASLTDGVYIARVTVEGQTETFKIIKR